MVAEGFGPHHVISVGEMWGTFFGLVVAAITLSCVAAALGRRFLEESSSRDHTGSHAPAASVGSLAHETAALRR